MTTTAAAPENIADFEDADSERWLSEKLEGARTGIQSQPTPEAIARMRARIFSEATRKQGKLAA